MRLVGGDGVTVGQQCRQDGHNGAEHEEGKVRGEKIGAAFFVWPVWASCFALALGYVAHYGVNFPTWDEYAFLPYTTGVKPITLEWLWSSHNGHRMLLPRLAFIGLIRAANGDFRAGMVAIVVLLAAGSFALIRAAGKARGRIAYTDAALPLALLHFGHASCMMWSVTIHHVMSAALSCLLLATIAGIRGALQLRRTLAIWGLLVLLTLSGASGITVTPPLALWLVLIGLSQMRKNRARGICVALLGTTIFAVMGVYVIGRAGGGGRLEASFVDAVLGTLEFLASSLGAIGMISVWPAMAIATGLAIVGIATAVWGWFHRPDERAASSGLLMFLGGMLTLAATVGWARAGEGRGYIIDTRRFATLSAPFLCAVYLTAVRLLPRASRRFVEMGVFALVCMVFAYNLRDGLDHGGLVRATKEAAMRDAWAGLSSDEIAERNYILGDRTVLSEGIEMIRQAGYGPFAVPEDQRASRLRTYYRRLCTGLRTVPDEIRCTREVERAAVRGQDVLVVHAPGDISFDLEPGTYKMTGAFGIMPRAWQAAETDGAVFQVLVRDSSGGEKVLMNRRLDPLWHEGDRGFQSLLVTITEVQPVAVILRSIPGPLDRHAWSFWTDVQISQDQPAEQ